MELKRHTARWIRRVVLIGTLAACAACSSQSDSTVSTSPVTTTTEVEWRTVPAPLTEEDEEKVRVRFVAYGDVDPNDDIPFGVISDVRIFTLNDGELLDWWDAIWDKDKGEMGQSGIPPGVQMQSTAEGIESVQTDFVTTESDGTTRTYVEPGVYTICVVSPIDELIAGCLHKESTGRRRDIIFYVYFSNGRAYIDDERDGGERYQRFLHRAQDSFIFSDEPATVTFVSTGETGEMGGPFVDFLASDASVAVIADADIDAWWKAVVDFEEADSHGNGFSLAVGGRRWDIRYGYATREMIRESQVNTGSTGIVETTFTPGDYLLCHINGQSILGCNYEDIAAARKYIFEVNYGVWTLSESEGQQLLEEAEDWTVRPYSFLNGHE